MDPKNMNATKVTAPSFRGFSSSPGTWWSSSCSIMWSRKLLVYSGFFVMSAMAREASAWLKPLLS